MSIYICTSISFALVCSNISGVYNATFPKFPPYPFNFTGDVGNNTLYPKLATKVLTIDYGAAVEIIFQGTNIGAAENHPMHLHGFSFYVVGMGDGNFNKSSAADYNLVDPPLINTVGLPKNGWTTIRFVADNPGPSISYLILILVNIGQISRQLDYRIIIGL